MKNEKVSETILYIAAVLFDIAAIISFAGRNETSTGVMCLCFGSMFLCLASSYSRKNKENEGKQDEEKNEKE